jgi:hypothetical protein
MKRTISPISLNNLIQFGSEDMPPEVHRALSAAGGRASGVSRRERSAKKKQIAEYLENRALQENIIDDIMSYRKWLARKRSMERKKAEREARKKHE